MPGHSGTIKPFCAHCGGGFGENDKSLAVEVAGTMKVIHKNCWSGVYWWHAVSTHNRRLTLVLK